MKTVHFVAVAAVMSQAPLAPASAQDSPDFWYGPEYQQCAGRDTLGIEECVRARFAEWERRLDEAYRALSASLETEQWREELRDVQHLWKVYRDANCRYYRGGPGSISRVEAAECLRAMTASRARELEQARRP